MSPKGASNAKSVIMSRVTNCAFRARSMGFNSASVEMYLVLIRLMRFDICLSILSSTPGFSLPEYYLLIRHVQLKVWKSTYTHCHLSSSLGVGLLIHSREYIVMTWLQSNPSIPVAFRIWRSGATHAINYFWIAGDYYQISIFKSRSLLGVVPGAEP